MSNVHVGSCDRCDGLYVDEMTDRNRDEKTGLATNLPTTSLSGFYLITKHDVHYIKGSKTRTASKML